MFAQADARPTRVGRTSLPSVVMDILAFRRRVQRGRSPLWRGLGGAPNPHPLRFPPGNSAGSGGRVQRERSPLWRGLGGTPPPPIRSASRQGIRRVPAGESREGAALVGGGLGYPPNLYPLSFPPGNSAGSGGRVQRGRSPRWWGFGGTPPTPIRSASRQGIRRVPAGESREGGALVGGGLGVPPPNPYPLHFPPGKWSGPRPGGA